MVTVQRYISPNGAPIAWLVVDDGCIMGVWDTREEAQKQARQYRKAYASERRKARLARARERDRAYMEA